MLADIQANASPAVTEDDAVTRIVEKPSVPIPKRSARAPLISAIGVCAFILFIVVIFLAIRVFDSGKRSVPRKSGVQTVSPTEPAPPFSIMVGEMVLIPAGEFQMGSNDGYDDEKPVHTVYVDAFYMDKYEVTNTEYARFLNDYGRNSDGEGHKLLAVDSDYCLIESVGNSYRAKRGYEKHPVIMVSWYGAKAYAEYYGKRLPTEAEWEKAARGGLTGKKYPWGDDISPDKANYDQDNSRGYSLAEMLKYLKPVGSYAPNRYGLYDMSGNVWECCSDWYDKDYYSELSGRNPKGPATGDWRLLRGGSWYGNADYLRCAARYYSNPTYTYYYVGFRCSE